MNRRLGFFEDGDGHQSMGRLIAFVGMVLGSVQVLEGNVLSFYETFFQVGQHTSNGIALAGLGVGLFTSGALLKGWQASSESRIPAGG